MWTVICDTTWRNTFLCLACIGLQAKTETSKASFWDINWNGWRCPRSALITFSSNVIINVLTTVEDLFCHITHFLVPLTLHVINKNTERKKEIQISTVGCSCSTGGFNTYSICSAHYMSSYRGFISRQQRK